MNTIEDLRVAIYLQFGVEVEADRREPGIIRVGCPRHLVPSIYGYAQRYIPAGVLLKVESWS